MILQRILLVEKIEVLQDKSPIITHCDTLLILTLDIMVLKTLQIITDMDFFPAFSLAWNIAEESFIKKALPFINMCKLRYHGVK